MLLLLRWQLRSGQVQLRRMTASDWGRTVRLDRADDGGHRYLTLGGVRGERSGFAESMPD